MIDMEIAHRLQSSNVHSSIMVVRNLTMTVDPVEHLQREIREVEVVMHQISILHVLHKVETSLIDEVVEGIHLNDLRVRYVKEVDQVTVLSRPPAVDDLGSRMFSHSLVAMLLLENQRKRVRHLTKALTRTTTATNSGIMSMTL